MANFALLLTKVCRSLVYDINIDFKNVVPYEKKGMAVDRKCHDNA